VGRVARGWTPARAALLRLTAHHGLVSASMRILVLGGTQFIGMHTVERLLEAGHDVTVFNRGQTADRLPASVERLRGDRGDLGMTLPADREWDSCIDLSGYLPAHVHASVRTLQGRVKHYVFVSTVSVYPEGTNTPVLEDAPLRTAAEDAVTEITEETYGPMKVRCEQIVAQGFPNSFTIVRPQIVVGPHDPTGRFAFWLVRAQEPEMLAPGDGTDLVQVVDVRDVAHFLVQAVETRAPGAYNLSGTLHTWSAFLRLLKAVKPQWVAARDLEDLTFVELPLFRALGSPSSHGMHVDASRALARGWSQTALHDTVQDTLTWIQAVGEAKAVPTDTGFISREEARFRVHHLQAR
jgi:2'-hydroxyisoflavone reductase